MRSARTVLATVTSAAVAAVLATGGTAAADALGVVAPPTIAGTPAVGSTLALTPPTWTLPDVVNKVQWLRDGTVIKIGGLFTCQITASDACPYTTTVEDAGHSIQARVTGSLSSELPGVPILSNVIAVPADGTGGGGGGAGGGSAIAIPVTAPTISGIPKVGSTLSVDGPVWSVTPTQTTSHWVVDGQEIADATHSTYQVKPGDIGKPIWFRAAGTLTGYLDTVTESNQMIAEKGDAPTPDPAPAIVGTYAVGQTLSVNQGVWGAVQPEPTYTYVWRRDDVAIPGATGDGYQLTRLDAGHTISLLLTASRPGYGDGTATVAGRAVPLLASSTAATLVKPRIKKGTHGVVGVSVTVPGLPAPGGRVSVYDGTRLLRTVRLPATGKLSVGLPTLKPGVHRIRARYLGSTGVLASRSRILRLTVRA